MQPTSSAAPPSAQSPKTRHCRCERPARASENGVGYCAKCGRKLPEQRPPSNGARLAEVERSLALARAALTKLLHREAKAAEAPDPDLPVSMREAGERLHVSYSTVRRHRRWMGFPPVPNDGSKRRGYTTAARIAEIKASGQVFPPKGWSE